MTDLEIKYPEDYDLLPFTTNVSVTTADNINAIRDAVLNIETVLGLNVNIGLFTVDPANATVSDRLSRMERGIAERNLVFRELNVSDALQVRLNRENKPYVNIGSGNIQIAPVTILGPLTILAPQVAEPNTFIQTPVTIDVTTFNPEMSSKVIIKGKSNSSNPLLYIQDTNKDRQSGEYALKIDGNVKITGNLEAVYSIDHNKLLNIETVPTDSTRGTTKHVTQGDYHHHKKGSYDSSKSSWIVDSSTSINDYGIIDHKNLQGWGTLPTHDNSFSPESEVQYHVTGGDLHNHSTMGGAQIDHNELKNISPKYSNHVTGGDIHAHTNSGDGGQVSHSNLADINTVGTNALHITGGDNHSHKLDENGAPVGDGAQIDHQYLLNIDPASSNHITGGDTHSHKDGAGGQVDHTGLSNIGKLTHDEIDAKISLFRGTKTGTASFTPASFDAIVVQHSMGTDQFAVTWSILGTNYAPSSDINDLGVIYVDEKTNATFKFKRLGGLAVGPAVKAQMTTSLPLGDFLVGPNSNLKYIARTAGVNGNNITIEYRHDETISSNPFIVSTLSSIIVYYKNTTSPYSPTANAVIQAIAADSLSRTLVDVVLSGGNGTGWITTMASTPLSGGLDTSGFQGLELEYVLTAKN